MNKYAKFAIVLVLAAVVAVVIAKKGASGPGSSGADSDRSLPRLVDLGSTTCVPCKLMAPILEDLKKEYARRMQVDFIDVNVDADRAKPFAIKLIPTQVFLDRQGKELFRHEGFFSKSEILAKWKDLGVELASAPASPAAPPVSVPSGST